MRELHGDAIAGVERALWAGTAVVLIRVGDGERELVHALRPPVVHVDATLYPERAAMRLALLREVVTRPLGADPRVVLADLGPTGDRAGLALAEAYGERASHVMTHLERDTPPPEGCRLSLAEVLAGASDDIPLVVFDAHRLDTDAPWGLRELECPLLLVTRPDHLDRLTADDAPFYGHAQKVSLLVRGAREWMRALGTIGVSIHPGASAFSGLRLAVTLVPQATSISSSKWNSAEACWTSSGYGRSWRTSSA